MKGIELAYNYYNEYGKPLIENDFSKYIGKIACGIVGNGSECYGYDDEISIDHDFCPGFYMWLTEETDNQIGFKLLRAYNKLPKEYKGITLKNKNTYGENKFGVVKINDFYRRLIGLETSPETIKQWFYLPEFAICNSTNGKVFIDEEGVFSSIRNKLKYSLPEDVRLKKISSRLSLMAQSGQYNYDRMIKRGETGGASLALTEFVNNSLFLIFAMNKEFTPYYKWRFKKLKQQKILGEFSSKLEYLISSPNDKECSKVKQNIIEEFCNQVIKELKKQNLTSSSEEYLEGQAFSVASNIKDRFLASLHIMETGE